MTANRFRFRCWDKNNHEMLNSFLVNSEQDIAWEMQDYSERPMSASRYHLMQSTGLCDKSGKEIFEGDVIRAELIVDRDIPTMGKVVWSDDYSGWANANDVGETMLYQLATIEVIGNIYENPELLEKEVG